MTVTPRTSFVVTCHNLGAYLPAALDSVEQQTDRDFEIVVVNDGSTDGATCRLLADLSGPRTRVVHLERRGLSGARNAGASHARGRFLCMVDADDLLEPQYLERSMAALTREPDVAFASHWFRAFGDEEWDWTPSDCTLPALLDHNTVNGAALMRRELFEAIGGFDETMTEGCEDWEFWIRATARGYRGVIIPEVLFRYRRRPDSMSRVMLDVPGMPALVRQLVDRHPALYASHVAALLARRDADIRSLSSGRWRLEEAWAGDLAGRIQWLRDNATADTARRATSHENAERDAAAADVQRLEAALDATRAEVRTLHADYNRERAENEATRASWSWRLTSPLRALAHWSRR